MAYRIFAINPGSTSTKIAMFEDDRKIFSANVAHDAEELKKYKEISDQFDYRKDTILAEVAKAGLTLEGARHSQGAAADSSHVLAERTR